jgi:hypothetical protein
MSPKSTRNSAATALAVLALSCASYPERTHRAFSDFQRGQLTKALAAYEDPHTTQSPFLTGAESGTVALAAGNWDAAVKNLSSAAKEVEAVERSALISPESLGETLLTWTLSEGAQSYNGEGYERVQVHAGLAIAYLAKGDLEGARVEVRQSNALLESEEKLYEKEYKAGGLGHFLSAVTYELEGQLDEAWIDYDRMWKKGVGMELAGRALVRLAKAMHREEELTPDVAKYGDADPMADSASIVVLAGVGLGPYKRETILPIPTPSGLLQWSVPSFVARPQPVAGVEASVAGGDQGVRTVVVEDIGHVAKENLEDRLAWLVAKSTVRAFLKRELTRELEEQAGILGRVAGDVFTFVSERADLRAWQTLPDTWQAARVFLPAGCHDLRVRALGGEELDLGIFELTKGETMFVIARTVDTKMYAYPVGGRRIPSAPVEATP